MNNINLLKNTDEIDMMSGGLLRIKKIFPDITTIIDVGAATGSWTEKAIKIWPNSNFLLVEPLFERRAHLEMLQKTFPNITLLHKALGKEKIKLQFSVTSDLDGSGFYNTGNLRDVEVIDLNSALKSLKLQGPYILKLDTHGYEIPILEGAKEILKDVRLIIVEVYGFNITPESFLFWQMTDHLDQLGFRLIDIVDVMRRPADQAFWQCDALFIPKTSAIFKSNVYA